MPRGLEKNGSSVFDQKRRLGHQLTNAFVTANILRELRKIGATGFYKKGTAVVSPDQILIGIPAYRNLVFAQFEPESCAARKIGSAIAFTLSAPYTERLKSSLSANG
jgi:hypothetical protein